MSTLKMARSLQRFSSQALALRPPLLAAASRPFSADADALVEIKPGEIGMVSGIPEEHLRRRVRASLPPKNSIFVSMFFALAASVLEITVVATTIESGSSGYGFPGGCTDFLLPVSFAALRASPLRIFENRSRS